MPCSDIFTGNVSPSPFCSQSATFPPAKHPTLQIKVGCQGRWMFTDKIFGTRGQDQRVPTLALPTATLGDSQDFPQWAPAPYTPQQRDPGCGGSPRPRPPEQNPALTTSSRGSPRQVNCKDGSARAESSQWGSLEKPIPTAQS